MCWVGSLVGIFFFSQKVWKLKKMFVELLRRLRREILSTKSSRFPWLLDESRDLHSYREEWLSSFAHDHTFHLEQSVVQSPQGHWWRFVWDKRENSWTDIILWVYRWLSPPLFWRHVKQNWEKSQHIGQLDYFKGQPRAAFTLHLILGDSGLSLVLALGGNSLHPQLGLVHSSFPELWWLLWGFLYRVDFLYRVCFPLYSERRVSITLNVYELKGL